ncbi:MAG: LysR family transcriptional regulator [Comamonas sp.]|nr:LysR family transcriptional regulator [Comamonas sp.]
MLPMTLRQMEVFTAVVRHGSTVAAAGALGLSQSATSAALQQLERVLGTTLFERQGRTLVLNAAGRTLLPQARNLLEQAQHLALRTCSRSPHGGAGAASGGLRRCKSSQ